MSDNGGKKGNIREPTNNVKFMNNVNIMQNEKLADDVKIEIDKTDNRVDQHVARSPVVGSSGKPSQPTSPTIPASPRRTKKLSVVSAQLPTTTTVVGKHASLKKTPAPPLYCPRGSQVHDQLNNPANKREATMAAAGGHGGGGGGPLHSILNKTGRPANHNKHQPVHQPTNHSHRSHQNVEFLKRPKSNFKNEDGSRDSFSAFAEEFVDVRKMETGLLNLLSDFHKGHLQAFGKDDAFLKMDEVRLLQEKISKKHFEIDMMHLSRGFESKEDRERNDENMSDLMVDLEKLSTKIQYIHSEMVDDTNRDEATTTTTTATATAGCDEGKTTTTHATTHASTEHSRMGVAKSPPVLEVPAIGRSGKRLHTGKHRSTGKLPQGSKPPLCSVATIVNAATNAAAAANAKTGKLITPPVINIDDDDVITNSANKKTS